MLTEDSKKMCLKARVYYYDYLRADLRASVPAEIVQHIEDCPICQGEVGRFKTELNKCEAAPARQNSLNIRSLKLQLSYCGSPVGCEIVKPFLPVLADSAIKLSVPTPITAHISQCQQCRESLEAIRGLKLGHNSLCRVGQLFAKPAMESKLCRDVQNTAGTMDLAEISLEDLQHLCSCSSCRDAIYQERPEIKVTLSTVFDIYQKPASDVVTTYYIDNKAAETESASCAPAIIDFAEKRKTSSLARLKPFLKPAIAAAAVLLFASILFIQPSRAKAISIDQIYEAIEKVNVIHKKSYRFNDKEPAQETWASRTQNLYLLKTRTQLVLWDITNQVRKLKNSDTSSIETEQLTDDKIFKIKKLIDDAIIVMPFYRVTDVPAGAIWSRVVKRNLNISHNIEVYDLTWAEEMYDGSETLCKWRVFINIEANLPQKIEWYQKPHPDKDYNLTSILEVEYPDESRIDTFIKETGF